MALAGHRRWASVALVEATLERFRAGWRAHATSDKRAFAKALAIGAAACALFAIALSLTARAVAAAGWLDWERPWMLRYAEHGPLDFQQALFAAQWGSSALLFPVALLAAWLAVRANRPLRAVALLAAVFAVKAVVLAGWMAWARERPDFIEGAVAVPRSLHAFPSGHVAQTVALYGLLVRLWSTASRSRIEQLIAWLAFGLLVVVVALARLRIGAHWPSDLVAGAAVGGAWLAVLLKALALGGELEGPLATRPAKAAPACSHRA